ncbi:hypothetical protein [Streptomyces fulvoviolaceus]|nr:hypothetical protein [Streptomyces fulvoviolaceus]MCT9078499.1 hypothetical protein [Streptomyces fulvoviolaceus]
MATVLVDTQMPGQRRRFLLHDDIASNLLHGRQGLQVTGGRGDDVV